MKQIISILINNALNMIIEKYANSYKSLALIITLLFSVNTSKQKNIIKTRMHSN